MNFLSHLRTSTLAQAALAFIAAALAIRFPVLTDWLGADVSGDIQKVCYEIKSWAWMTMLLFVKGYKQTGGTKPVTEEASARIGEPMK